MQHMRDQDHLRRGLIELVERTGRTNMEVIEIGSYAGESAEIMLSTGRIDKIYCVDPWIPNYAKDDWGGFPDNLIPAEKEFDERFKDESRVVKVKSTIQDAVRDKTVPSFVDLVYIDGNHTYDSVVSDIRTVCNRCLFLSGHDFGGQSVKDAVTGIYGDQASVFCDSSWLITDPKRSCCVVIPVYKSLSPDEEESLSRAIDILGKHHDIVFICGESFNIDVIPEKYRGAAGISRFSDSYFTDLFAYNDLCCSPDLYSRFLRYTHIIIYQLDGYVYRDDLLERWMKYDYVGAPWCFTCGACTPEGAPYKVGNGGVSLRNVKKCLDVTLKLTPKSPILPEDKFVFSDPSLSRPSCLEACEFSLESGVRQAYGRTRGHIPSFSHKLRDWDPVMFRLFRDISSEETNAPWCRHTEP